MAQVEGAPAHGAVAHLLPQTYKRYISEWLEEDTPSFDYGGFVVGDEESEAKLLGKSEVSQDCHCPVRKLLLGERVALNTLARCSGIATKSDRLLVLLRKAGYPNILAGTRKTTPGFRLVEKYGMLVGGVDAHRVDLSHMTMLKDNHIVAAGSITNAVRAAKSAGGFATKIEVECQSFEEADEAIAAGADIVMLDNFTPDGVKVAAAQLKEKWGRGTGDRKAFLVEVSGGLTEHNVEKYVCGDIDISLNVSLANTPGIDAIHITEVLTPDTSPAFQVSMDRLLELYYENFWPAFPLVLPFHFLRQRQMSENHGMDELLLVLQYVGSMYAPWTPSEPYFKTALDALTSPILAHTPFNVQALMLLAIAQYHNNMKEEGHRRLHLAVSIALELRMNQKGFAQAYGESNPVLEESWRRTYYLLHVADQHLAIVSNSPIHTLGNVPNMVDLPCDDEYYEAGQIPRAATWQDYENREFEEVEVIYSSIVYLYDLVKIVASVMDMFLETGTFGEAMIERCDTKLAIWTSLLPACKKDPLRKDGRVDEVMFAAHMIAIITISTMHRPFSNLSLSPAEMTTQAFLSPTPFVAPPKQGRAAHTARTLRAVEMHTKLLAIPCAIERHNVFTMCMSAQLAVAQISACANLLEDHALSIARDRVRLSIGFLNAMGSFWPLGKLMAREVRHIARAQLSNNQNTIAVDSGPATEIDLPRDEIIWPIDPSAQIDIYSGLMLPVDWDTTNFSYSSSTSSSLT
ncbi:Quinolinate phosphoribosyl transferase [Paraphoma chrysanthemicola]|uniref:Nicotinate-nucleotide pyrophosphorylase [carboxylating] n=1 Tax=Paraphoma chrysanthemicola TaxID=798071 RepID=A0A8K0RJS4_9PLEO|nr:Quinolinate phosphoribosyl transferase [Paraphoma chrysanthemicola]